MKSTGRITMEASEAERLDKEMEDEIIEQKQQLSKYTMNIKSLLGERRSREVRRAMIQYLVENL